MINRYRPCKPPVQTSASRFNGSRRHTQCTAHSSTITYAEASAELSQRVGIRDGVGVQNPPGVGIPRQGDAGVYPPRISDIGWGQRALDPLPACESRRHALREQSKGRLAPIFANHHFEICVAGGLKGFEAPGDVLRVPVAHNANCDMHSAKLSNDSVYWQIRGSANRAPASQIFTPVDEYSRPSR